ncbi:hypothetical protein DENSPDRAFT_399880 [Dentipellis sp. KUC8613]|nr:hypothetical protein DENSPDRAFT_399880 [Dentipellis sp. KUC8613]
MFHLFRTSPAPCYLLCFSLSTADDIYSGLMLCMCIFYYSLILPSSIPAPHLFVFPFSSIQDSFQPSASHSLSTSNPLAPLPPSPQRVHNCPLPLVPCPCPQRSARLRPTLVFLRITSGMCTLLRFRLLAFVFVSLRLPCLTPSSVFAVFAGIVVHRPIQLSKGL